MTLQHGKLSFNNVSRRKETSSGNCAPERANLPDLGAEELLKMTSERKNKISLRDQFFNCSYMMTDDGESMNKTDDESFMTPDDLDSYLRTDDESYVRTDEEDAELFDHMPKVRVVSSFLNS